MQRMKCLLLIVAILGIVILPASLIRKARALTPSLDKKKKMGFAGDAETVETPPFDAGFKPRVR